LKPSLTDDTVDIDSLHAFNCMNRSR